MRLQRELNAVREDFSNAGKQLGFAMENFERADKRLARFEGRLGAIEPSQNVLLGSSSSVASDMLPMAAKDPLEEIQER